jgi:hypothetical protein
MRLATPSAMPTSETMLTMPTKRLPPRLKM